jgi:hypothetical protein
MDHALDIRRRLIMSANTEPTQHQHIDALCERLAEDLWQKRNRAISWLGSTWTHHDYYDSKLHPHHNAGHKHSITLSKFLHERGAVEAGRV